jgi:microcystin degradation protein MlrC
LAGSNTEFGGFLAGAARHGFDLRPIVAVWATPSGLVGADAIETLTGLLIGGLNGALTEGPLDGVLLALHGSMVTAVDHDGDAHLLEAARKAVGPGVPIVATLDLHANLSKRMVAAADVLIGYDTYPHVDMAERGEEACNTLARLIRGEIWPTPALRKPPMLPTSQRMMTDRCRCGADRARPGDGEDPRVVNVTVAGGFPRPTCRRPGFSVLVTTDDDPDAAAGPRRRAGARSMGAAQGFLGGVTAGPRRRT